MRFLASLDANDRRMLFLLLGMVALLLVLLAVFTPAEDPNTNPIPDSYLAGKHGAKAAFTLLQQSGYAIERWEQPLGDLAAQAGPGAVLILAEPIVYDRSDRRAIASILQKGGRVVATGLNGGILLPGNEITLSSEFSFAACEARPDGLSPLAGTGPIWIVPRATWKEVRSDVQTAYTCAGLPVVVTYPVGKGTAVWWASSTPLENGSIERGQNLELLLHSVGPAENQRIYWDESLHSPPPSQWEYVSGPVWPLLFFGSLGLALLTILSFSRRSGPVRPLPQAARSTPIEFLEALGALYRSTGAAVTAMQIAWERFRTEAALLTGQKTAQLDAAALAAAIARRFGPVGGEMEPDLVAAQEACWDDSLKPRRALALIQTLRRHEEALRAAGTRPRQSGAARAEVTLGT